MERDLKEVVKEHPNIFLPPHLRGDPQSTELELWTDPFCFEAMSVAFDFLPEESEIFNESANLDLYISTEEYKSAVGIIFGTGGVYNIKGEMIAILVHYLFNSRDMKYGEKYGHPKRILALMKSYKTRMYGKYPSAEEWLKSIFRLKYKRPPKNTIKWIIQMSDIKWGSLEL
jgi:hypothetical protein